MSLKRFAKRTVPPKSPRSASGNLLLPRFSGNVQPMSFLRPLGLLGAIFIFAGCGEDQPITSAAVAGPAAPTPTGPKLDPAFPTRPQPRLRTKKLWLTTNEVTAEIARSPNEIHTGMMVRTNMDEMEGMLFVFTEPQQLGFWMKNTLLPLSCAYMAPDGTILELHDMQPLNTNTIMAATDQVQYVLEMNQGWFQRQNVSTGVVVQTSDGPFSKVFFGH